jgi:hypothetical protein
MGWGRFGPAYLVMSNLRSRENDADFQGENLLSTRAVCKLIAAARKEWFGAKPGSALTDGAPENQSLHPQ